jgi:hypothetical protein
MLFNLGIGKRLLATALSLSPDYSIYDEQEKLATARMLGNR